MKELKFIIDYDDQPDDCIEKINEQLKEVGYKIDYAECEESDNGTVEYEIIEYKEPEETKKRE